mgnify:CR=1 FL=1
MTTIAKLAPAGTLAVLAIAGAVQWGVGDGFRLLPPALPLIGVGGIDSPEVAWERITAGASLVQLYTGWIYQGPTLVPRILEGFSRQLDRHGLAHIGQAVGSGLPWRA